MEGAESSRLGVGLEFVDGDSQARNLACCACLGDDVFGCGAVEGADCIRELACCCSCVVLFESAAQLLDDAAHGGLDVTVADASFVVLAVAFDGGFMVCHDILCILCV